MRWSYFFLLAILSIIFQNILFFVFDVAKGVCESLLEFLG